MASLSFQSGSTWRKLGYAIHSNSLSYREVLEDNPQWDVMKHPPIGTRLRSSMSSRASAGLSQQSSVIGIGSNSDSLVYYPFDNRQDYSLSLVKYTSSSLNDVEKINGWSQNSIVADSGYQG